MAFDFPNSPTIGQTYPSPAVAGQPVYTWDGEKWATGSGFGSIYIADAAPAAPVGSLWWESDTGLLYVKYNDGTSTQWVIAAPQPDMTTFVQRAGDTMTGPLALAVDPTTPLQAATKQYSDRAVRTDFAQSFNAAQQAQARQNIFAAPIDALAYNGMQINGSMDVSQLYGTTVQTTAGYILDGWGWAGQSATTGRTNIQQGAYGASGYGGFNNNLTMSCTAAQASLATTDLFFCYQPIEGFRVSRLGWGATGAAPVTIAFWTGHQRPGTYSISIRNGSATRSYVATYQQNVSATWEYKVVTIPGDTAGTWAKDNTLGMTLGYAMACGPTYTAPAANSWQAGNYVAAPSQINGVQATTDVFRLMGVVVLPGVEAPPIDRAPLIMRPYDQEFMLCRRYLIYESGYDFWLHPIDLTNIYRRHEIKFIPVMRAAPTVTITAQVSGAFAAGMPAAAIITPLSCELQGDLTGAGYAYVTTLKADARL